MAHDVEQYEMSSINDDQIQSSRVMTRGSVRLSLKKSVKALGVNSVKSLGTLVGLSDEKDIPLSLWKETWLKKVQSGATGMSLQITKSKIVKDGTPEEQIKGTLTKLIQISDSITSSALELNEDDTSFLEQFHNNQHIASELALISDDDELRYLISQIQLEDNRKNTDVVENKEFGQEATDELDTTYPLFDSKAVEKSPFVSCTNLNKQEKEQSLESAENKAKENETTAIDHEQVDIDIRKSASDSSEDNRYVYGREALFHYKLFKELEKRNHEETRRKKKEQSIEKLKGQLEMLDQLVRVGKEFFHSPTGKAAKEWKELQKDVSQKCSQELELENQLGNLPVYFPYFTIFITITQVITFVTLCVLGGVTTIGFEPQYELQNNIKTFLGTETVHNLIIPNPWIGPANAEFIGFGAMYAPCMREDFFLNLEIMKQNYSQEEVLGCCEIFSRNTAGTTTESECDTLTNGVGVWRESVMCSQRVSGNNSVQHNMKPCCVGAQGTCELFSHPHCIFLNGIYHISGIEHCSQVNCLSTICGLGGLDTVVARPWIAASPNQWWRLLLSLIYNQGLIQLILVCAGHSLLTRHIEPIAGWLRISIIYILSGICGVTAGAVFSPYEPHFGTIGSLFGMMGVTVVEFLQSWKLVKRPYRELAKLMTIILMCCLCGTLPFISIFQLLFSLLSGILNAVILLPYVTFGRWNKRGRQSLVGVSVPLQILLIFILLFMFYRVQTVHNNCGGCERLECIPYTDKFCLTG